MQGKGIVIKTDGTNATVRIRKSSACGHDCEECAGCGVTGAAVLARAANPIGARVGQKVVVQSETSKMLGIVALVYLIPVALFLIGYVTMAFLTPNVAVQYGVAIAGFFIGIAFAILYDRKLKERGGLTFTITRLF